MVDGVQNSGSVGGVDSAPVAALRAAGSEALHQRIEKIREAQRRLLAALQNNQLPLSQVAAEMARLESDLAEAQRGLKIAAGIPA
jgi:hypothetical protein